MCEVLSSVEFWKFSAPLFGAVIAWFVNEWRKLASEQYQRKEESYKELIQCLKGFYEGAPNSSELKIEFLNQLNRCWLYCPDDVIKKGYAFLDTVNGTNPSTDEIKKEAMGEFIVAIRKDLLSRKLVKSTNLQASDFKHLNVN